MHLAEISEIGVVPHSQIRLSSGKLSYTTRRIDSINEARIHMEDMCQLTERLTEQKYNGSHEQIGKAIVKYSTNLGLDIINFFEQVLFSFLMGNADMHLKNFSLLNKPEMGYVLSPAYDMVALASAFMNNFGALAILMPVVLHIVGYVALILSVILILVGLYRYFQIKARLGRY